MHTTSSAITGADVPTERSPRAARTAPLRLAHTALATPCGELDLFASDRGLLSIALPNESRAEAMRRLEHAHGSLAVTSWVDQVDASAPPTSPVAVNVDESAIAILALALDELRAYFADGATGDPLAPIRFTAPLDLRGTPFQRQAWLAVAEIPYGVTRTYSEIARAVGRPAAVRAVGAANGANPLPIIVPCHRVIGADHTLTGYGGGLPMKRWLLAHEGVALASAY